MKVLSKKCGPSISPSKPKLIERWNDQNVREAGEKES